MPETFETLGVRADLVQGLDGLGIQTPTPVQSSAIPFLLSAGSDLIAQAQTGTGKTVAFGIPLLMKVDPAIDQIQGLIVAPTRELAKQIGKELFRFTKFCNPKIFVEVAAGGDKIEDQIQRLSRPTLILVATPGRLMDLLKSGLQLDGVKYLILDEADEMLSMGFQQELAAIFKETLARKATWLFSATFQKRVEGLIQDNMSANAQRLQVEPKQIVNRNIDHQFALCAREEKDAFIINYLKGKGGERGLIFCRTRAGAIRMGEELEKVGLSVGVIQGDLSQKDRDKVMRGFKKERIQFLIGYNVMTTNLQKAGQNTVASN